MILGGGVLPRRVQVGPLVLDLLHRDARLGEAWLYLNPRLFELIWRLAETPRKRLTRSVLLRDVWRLRHVPETNSLEVHICRLRKRLGEYGLDTLVVTDPRGGYRLDADVEWLGPHSALDSHTRIVDDNIQGQELEESHGISQERAGRDRAG